MTDGRPRTIALFTSLTARGSIGARAALFALERLGHTVVFLPTVILPFHPGHGPGTRSATDSVLFSQQISELISTTDLAGIDAVLTGYFANREQVECAARFTDAVKDKNPDAVFLCDPVCGDGNRLYVPEETAGALRDLLLPRADFITPNRFEFSWLTGHESAIDENETIIREARQLGVRETLVTSALPLMRGSTATLLVSPEMTATAEHRAFPHPPNGMGDLISALYLHHTLSGAKAADRLQRSVASVLEILTFSLSAGSKELLIPARQDAIVSPRASVTIRQLLTASAG